MSSNALDFGEYIEFEIKKRFGVITLNRVDRSNAFTIDQLKNLKKAVAYCQENEKIRGLILTANGNSFSTGMDINKIDASDHNLLKDIESTASEICTLLYNGKPAICAINGRAFGEGVVFLLCCDYRIAVKDSFFQMPEINSAIFPGTGCIVLMTRLIGIPWTKKMLMFAEKVSSEKALEIGLIDQIVESNDVLFEEALKKARFVGSKNQFVVNTVKLYSNHLLDKTYRDAYKLEKEGYFAWVSHKDRDQFLKDLRERLK